MSFSESADIRDTWLTVEGKLVTSRYEAEFDHGEFCVDTVEDTASVVAVMCDACKKGVRVRLHLLSTNFDLDIPGALYLHVWPPWTSTGHQP